MTSGPTLVTDQGAWLHVWKANTLGKLHTKYEAGSVNGFGNTVQPVLNKHQRDNQNVPA